MVLEKKNFKFHQFIFAISLLYPLGNGSEIPTQSAKGEEKGDRERNPWLAKMLSYILHKKHGDCN